MEQNEITKSQLDNFTDADSLVGRIRQNKIVVYTAITDNYDHLYEPLYKCDKFDYVCFTDNPNLKSDFWKIKTFQHCNYDATRKARYVKILPHLFFQDYNYSVWVDA